jgi:hypothetical protein
MKKIMALIILLTSILSAMQPNEFNTFNNSEIQNFEETKFTITAGSISINAIGKYADGDYILQEAAIAPLENKNSYTATLKFSLKKGMLSYSHIESIGILYDREKLWIKYMGKVYRYSVPTETRTIDKQASSITYKTQKPYLDVVIEKMKLRFEF